jgi:hypothetical protein
MMKARGVLKPLSLTANALAKAIGVPMATVHFAAMTGALPAGCMAGAGRGLEHLKIESARPISRSSSKRRPGSVGNSE